MLARRWGIHNSHPLLLTVYLEVILLSYHQGNPYLDKYWREMKMSVYKKTWTPTFMATLFAIAPNWKQSNVHQQENDKLWYIHTVECYLPIKRNYWYPHQGCGQVSEQACWEKNDRYKGLHNVWFHSYEILENTILTHDANKNRKLLPPVCVEKLTGKGQKGTF